MLGLAEASYEQHFLIGALVGIAQLGLAMSNVEWALENRPADLFDDHLQQLSQSLASFLGGGDVPMPLEGERDLFLDSVQHAYTNDGKGNGRLTADGVRILTDMQRFPLLAEVTGGRRQLGAQASDTIGSFPAQR